MPEPHPPFAYRPIACLFHETTDLPRAEELHETLSGEYDFIDFRMIPGDSPEEGAMQQATGADILLLLCPQRQLPAFNESWWQTLLSCGCPPLMFIGADTQWRTGSAPFTDKQVVHWDSGHSIEKVKRRFGSLLGLAGGRVYIAFGKADGLAIAEQMNAALNARGFQTFFDLRDEVDATDGFGEEFSREMRRMNALILIETPAARQSTHVATEVRFATERMLLVKPLVWLPAGEQSSPPKSRYLDSPVDAWEIISSENLGPLAYEPLARFLDSFEDDLEYDLKRKASLQTWTRRMFEVVLHSFSLENRQLATFRSGCIAPGREREPYVLSNCSARPPEQTRYLEAFAQYATTEGRDQQYRHRYFVHHDKYLTEKRAKQLNADHLAPQECVLLHYTYIPGQRELRA
jgi:hypothetical protein